MRQYVYMLCLLCDRPQRDYVNTRGVRRRGMPVLDCDVVTSG